MEKDTLWCKCCHAFVPEDEFLDDNEDYDEDEDDGRYICAREHKPSRDIPEGDGIYCFGCKCEHDPKHFKQREREREWDRVCLGFEPPEQDGKQLFFDADQPGAMWCSKCNVHHHEDSFSPKERWNRDKRRTCMFVRVDRYGEVRPRAEAARATISAKEAGAIAQALGGDSDDEEEEEAVFETSENEDTKRSAHDVAKMSGTEKLAYVESKGYRTEQYIVEMQKYLQEVERDPLVKNEQDRITIASYLARKECKGKVDRAIHAVKRRRWVVDDE